jgi:hypothetical protein
MVESTLAPGIIEGERTIGVGTHERRVVDGRAGPPTA